MNRIEFIKNALALTSGLLVGLPGIPENEKETYTLIKTGDIWTLTGKIHNKDFHFPDGVRLAFQGAIDVYNCTFSFCRPWGEPVVLMAKNTTGFVNTCHFHNRNPEAIFPDQLHRSYQVLYPV